MSENLKKLYTSLILQNGSLVPETVEDHKEIIDLTKALINGHYIPFMQANVVAKCIFQNEDVKRITEDFVSDPDVSLLSYLQQLVFVIENNVGELYFAGETKKTYILFLAVLLLQWFVITNFSGPRLPLTDTNEEAGFLSLLLNAQGNTRKRIHSESLSLLTIAGCAPYHLTESPILLVLALKLFEKLQGAHISLLNSSNLNMESDTLIEKSFDPDLVRKDDTHSFMVGAACWWRARALQVQQSLLPDISPELTSLSLKLLCNKVVDSLVDHSTPNSDTNQNLLITYYLETANIAVAGDLEVQTLDAIINANKISGLSLVLTGCKAKMTKFQQKSTATLTLLAKSHETMLRSEQNEPNFDPQDVKLNDDLFWKGLNMILWETLNCSVRRKAKITSL